MKAKKHLAKLWPLVVSAAIVTAMAASHGVLAESLFKSLKIAPAVLVISSTVALGGFAWLFWNRDELFDQLRGHDQREMHRTFDRRLALLALLIFVLLMAIQGVLALSVGHLVAETSHHNLAVMIGGGAVGFFFLTLGLWALRDRVFNLDTEVSQLHEDKHPLHAAVVILSPSGKKDDEMFKAAKLLFKEHHKASGWEGALNELIRPHEESESLYRWNFQQPLRLFEAMTRAVTNGRKRRVLIFLTTKQSDARFAAAKDLLDLIIKHMPDGKGPKPDIRLAHGHLIGGNEASENWVENNQFEKSFEIIRRVMKALKKEFEPHEIAFDTTGGTAEHSVMCAVATIDSRVAFTYVNTYDHKVRRFNVRAKAIGVTE